MKSVEQRPSVRGEGQSVGFQGAAYGVLKHVRLLGIAEEVFDGHEQWRKTEELELTVHHPSELAARLEVVL